MKILYLIFLITGIIGNICLVILGYETWSPCLIVVCSVMVSFFGYKNYRKAGDIKQKELDQNVNEAQKIISENVYGIFRYGNNLNINSPSLGVTIRELIAEPLIWILSVSLMVALFYSSVYLDFDKNSIENILKLGLVTFLQILFMSLAISGICIFIFNKIKNGIKADR